MEIYQRVYINRRYKMKNIRNVIFIYNMFPQLFYMTIVNKLYDNKLSLTLLISVVLPLKNLDNTRDVIINVFKINLSVIIGSTFGIFVYFDAKMFTYCYFVKRCCFVTLLQNLLELPALAFL